MNWLQEWHNVRYDAAQLPLGGQTRERVQTESAETAC